MTRRSTLKHHAALARLMSGDGRRTVNEQTPRPGSAGTGSCVEIGRQNGQTQQQPPGTEVSEDDTRDQCSEQRD